MHLFLATVMAMAVVQAQPNFTGAWIFDAEKSAAMVRETTHRSVTLLLGGEALISHANGALSMVIQNGGQTITASYMLDGTESRNLSPGAPGSLDIPIVSRSKWVGAVLEITTTSESEVDGRKVPVESVRRLWMTPAGDLVIERKGTPAQLVPASACVYRRKPLP